MSHSKDIRPHLIHQNNPRSFLFNLKNFRKFQTSPGTRQSFTINKGQMMLLLAIVQHCAFQSKLKNRVLWYGRQAFSSNTPIYFTFIISVLLSSVCVTPRDAAQRRGAMRCRWAGSDNSTGWKGEERRQWEMEGGGEWRRDVEVKRVIKYQKAIKTRRHINLPSSSPMCDTVFILSDFLASYLTLCVLVSATY